MGFKLNRQDQKCPKTRIASVVRCDGRCICLQTKYHPTCAELLFQTDVPSPHVVDPILLAMQTTKKRRRKDNYVLDTENKDDRRKVKWQASEEKGTRRPERERRKPGKGRKEEMIWLGEEERREEKERKEEERREGEAREEDSLH